ncbi:MAG: DUF4412 domain-containing protein [Verrucomicrobiales bacterium]|nr:DUF4412 domain-containing protein [Verrucomicrobiales bacterium]
MFHRVFIAFMVLCLAVPAVGQGPMQGPPTFRGVWAPVVGSGAAYQVETNREKREMEMAVVGTEPHEGKTGHWLEIFMKDPRQGDVVMKMLIVLDGSNTRSMRMIMQTQEMGPIEMPINLMGGGRGQTVNEADFRDKAERVGTESITTAAGTFACEHYRNKEDGADIWVAEKIAPYGLVKMISKDGTTMTLTRVITGAKSRIVGTPQKFDPGAMMREHP